MDRMKELVKILNDAAFAYYQANRPVMEDIEYDRLYDELSRLEDETGIVLAGSPTQRVGFTVLSGLNKVRHEKKMLSLDKTKEIPKLAAFLLDKEGLLSWKMDGLTIVLRYENGKLAQAVTRGNGEVGEDVTHNAVVFKNIPIKISYANPLTVRGEAVIPFADFEKINDSLPPEEQYKNPRNLCSGTVRQLNSEVAAGRAVNFYAFSLVNVDDVNFEDSKENQMKWLASLGFDVVEGVRVNADTVLKNVEDFRERAAHTPYATDGLVLTYDSLSFSENLGATAKFPKDSIAFKWADEQAETTLLEIQWNTSRTGLINPVAVFEPVELEGTTVNKASLHNVSVMEGLEIGVGDKILVYKANMIIPQIAENLSRSCHNVEASLPKYCPACGFGAEVLQAKEGKTLCCANPNCKAQLVRGLTHFTSRDAMNIEGLSEATLEKFVERGFLENYADIFELSRFENEIVNMDGFGEKSFANLMAAIEKSKDVYLSNFIYALGINQIGSVSARQLCENFGDPAKIENAVFADLLEIDGFGEVLADSATKYFADTHNRELYEKALGFLRIIPVEKKAEQPLAGLTFVITGDVHGFANRKELQSFIEARGGKAGTSVSAKTSFLINNDSLSGSAKNKKAHELNVEIITEDEFMERFGGQ